MASCGRSWNAGILARLAVGLALLAPVSRQFFQVSRVQGCSMRPTLQDGDRLVVDRLSVRLGKVERFDVVILGNPRDPSEDYVKRVVGLPGERVGIERGRLTVDGRVVGEYYPKVLEAGEVPPRPVPEGHYFVLGDNRPVSLDSREFGVVPAELIRGKVRFLLWPPEHAGRLPRD